MNYFQYYPTIEYRFGEETQSEYFRNIAIFVDVLEDIQNIVSLYQDYYIQDGERPDQVSYKLYDDPTFHWTFFFINNKLKQSSWPVKNESIITKLQKQFNHTVITTRDNIATTFKIGETVSGLSSGQTGVIRHKMLDNGQIAVDGNPTFNANETVQSSSGARVQIVGTGGPEYLVAHHYEDGDGNWVDIDPFIGPTDVSAVSLYDMYLEKNTELRQIKVIKPSKIAQVANAFKQAVKS